MDKEKIIKISKKLLPLLLPAGLGTAMQISEGIKEIIESNVNKDLNQIKLTSKFNSVRIPSFFIELFKSSKSSLPQYY